MDHRDNYYQGTNDGAAALILASEEALTLHKLTPLSRIAGWACAGVEPALMGIGAAVAVRRLLTAARMTMDDIDLIEVSYLITLFDVLTGTYHFVAN